MSQKQVSMVLSFTDSMDLSLSKLREMVKDTETWHAAVHGVTKTDETERLEQQQIVLSY